MITSIHFLRKEIHLSLFCTLSTVSVLLAASIRVRQSCECAKPGWEYSLRDSFLHFAQPGVYPNFFRISCEMFHVLWHWAFFNRHEWWFIPTQYWTWNIRQYISQNTRGGPRRAFDLITRPSPFRATMCSSVWKRFPQPRAQVPPLRHDTSWNLPSNSEHHCCSEGQEHSSVLTSLQSLISRFTNTRHMACCSGCPLRARQSTETPASGRR